MDETARTKERATEDGQEDGKEALKGKGSRAGQDNRKEEQRDKDQEFKDTVTNVDSGGTKR